VGRNFDAEYSIKNSLMVKAGWREYLIGTFLVLAGIIYLGMQLTSILRSDNSSIRSNSQTIVINRYALLNELRTYITISCCIAGGLLLIRLKKLGWMLSLCMLLLFTSIALATIVNLLALGLDTKSLFLILSGSLFMLFLLGLLLSLYRKFVLQKNDWIKAILLCTILGLFYFLLQ
jgi:hypothetical protein